MVRANPLDPMNAPPSLPPGDTLPPRLKRTVELVYSVEGVIGARVWQWQGGVAVGVRLADRASPTGTIERVQTAVAAVREPGEEWDFGILADGPPWTEKKTDA
jgi:hypothetical protein